MNHWDEFELAVLFSPGGIIGVIFILICLAIAISRDGEVKDFCKQHDETYIDSTSRTITCAKPDGALVTRVRQ